MTRGRGENLIGKRFGRLVVVGEAESDHKYRRRWLCRCDCGNEKTILAQNLKCGDIRSCGCYSREKTIERNTKHGIHNTRIYSIWTGMIHRCMDKTHLYYKHYGGRGISVCPEWRESVTAFYNWAMANGYSDGLTIDRIDPNGNYEPTNCRWADTKTQAINKRSTVKIEINGQTRTIEEWAEISGVKYSTIWYRYRAGKTGDDLIKKTRK